MQNQNHSEHRLRTRVLMAAAGCAASVLALGLAGCDYNEEPVEDEVVTQAVPDEHVNTGAVVREETAPQSPAGSTANRVGAAEATNAGVVVLESGWTVQQGQAEGGAANAMTLQVPGPDGGEGLVIERVQPKQVRAGETLSYQMEVTNAGDYPVHDVVITEWRSGRFQVQNGGSDQNTSQSAANNAAPNAAQNHWQSTDQNQARPPNQQGSPQGPNPQNMQASANNSSEWTIERLSPGQSRTIEVQGVAPEEGTVRTCMAVRYEPSMCFETEVVKPQLRVRQAVEQNTVYVCDDVDVVYTIENTGSAVARDAQLVEKLPQGVTTADGASQIAISIPSIDPGQSVERQVTLRAEGPTTFASSASLRSGDIEANTSETTIQFIRPELNLTVDMPQQEYVGRDVPMQLTISNPSNWPAMDTHITIPGLAELPRATLSTQRAEMTDSGIDIGPLNPGESRTMTLTFSPQDIQQQEFRIAADAYCAAEVTKTAALDIIGIEAVRLEAYDLVDPVVVGEPTVYEVQVKNQGTADSINVSVNARLPDEMTFMSGQGDSKVSGEGQQFQMAPIKRLAPGDVATWRVRAMAESPAKTRLRLELTSDATRRPVIEQEPTTIVDAPATE